MDLIIEECVLDEFIKESSSKGEVPHKGIYNLLKSIRLLGYMYRETHRIVLTNTESEAELDEEYAKYLDKRASGLKVKFHNG